MKKLLVTALSLSLPLGLAVSTPASADTYAVVINALKQPINLGGASIQPGGSAWTPLDATIVLPNGRFASIKDMHLQSKDGGWLIQSIATLPSVIFVNLKFAEVGCIAAVVSNINSDEVPLYRIDMQQMPGTRCADSWWQGSGKETITQVVNWIQTGQKNAIDALGLLAK